jgi:flagellar basal-body rod protein FlgB
MLDKLTDSLGFQARALVLRADRQQTLASNIANADTPGYQARDFKFADAMRDATGGSARMAGNASGMLALAGTQGGNGQSGSGFIPLTALSSSGGVGGPRLQYVTETQPSMDGNTVDLDRERAAFADNAIRYGATLRFINGESKTLLTAIQGQ